LDSASAGLDLAGGVDLASTGGLLLGLTGGGSASAFRTGVSGLGCTTRGSNRSLTVAAPI